jgi:hypothetical protein
LAEKDLKERLFGLLEKEVLFRSKFAPFFKHVTVAVRDSRVAIVVNGWTGALKEWGTDLRFNGRVVENGFDGDGVAVGRGCISAESSDGGGVLAVGTPHGESVSM